MDKYMKKDIYLPNIIKKKKINRDKMKTNIIPKFKINFFILESFRNKKQIFILARNTRKGS